MELLQLGGAIAFAAAGTNAAEEAEAQLGFAVAFAAAGTNAAEEAEIQL